MWDANEVIPGLYLGSVDSAVDVEQLRAHNVKLVVSFLNKAEVHVVQKLVQERQYDDDVHWRWIDVDDVIGTHSRNAMAHALPSVYKTIRNVLIQPTNKSDKKTPRNAVLVHCWGGVSRSATAVTAFVARYKNIPISEALAIVERARPVATPNPTFMGVLGQWENTYLNKNSSSKKYCCFR